MNHDALSLASDERLESMARAMVADLEKAEERVRELQKERADLIRDMRSRSWSWDKIGRTFKVTPQAVMYASGLVTRSKRNKAQDPEVPEM